VYTTAGEDEQCSKSRVPEFELFIVENIQDSGVIKCSTAWVLGGFGHKLCDVQSMMQRCVFLVKGWEPHYEEKWG
jgi:hypothetical protein